MRYHRRRQAEGAVDGNPCNLFPLSPAETTRRIAALVGGERNLVTVSGLLNPSGSPLELAHDRIHGLLHAQGFGALAWWPLLQ